MLKFIPSPSFFRFLFAKSLGTIPGTSKPSNTPRPPKDPPDEGYEPDNVNHDGIEVPDFVMPKVYRTFSKLDETLGPGAGQNKEYKNAHYFGYHRFSFVELQLQSVELRNESHQGCGLQATTEVYQEEEEERDDSLEAIQKQEEECEKKIAAQAMDIQGDGECVETSIGNQHKDSKAVEKEHEEESSTVENKIVIILSDCEDKEEKEVGNVESFDCKEVTKETVEEATKDKDSPDDTIESSTKEPSK